MAAKRAWIALCIGVAAFLAGCGAVQPTGGGVGEQPATQAAPGDAPGVDNATFEPGIYMGEGIYTQRQTVTGDVDEFRENTKRKTVTLTIGEQGLPLNADGTEVKIGDVTEGEIPGVGAMSSTVTRVDASEDRIRIAGDVSVTVVPPYDITLVGTFRQIYSLRDTGEIDYAYFSTAVGAIGAIEAFGYRAALLQEDELHAVLSR